MIEYALTIRQPWAWLIVQGHKDIENRSWATNIRGRIAIHAGKTFDFEGYEFVQGEFPRIQLPSVGDLVIDGGHVIGTAEVVDCVTESESAWFTGEYGFELRDARPCELIRLRGQQRFFKLPGWAARRLG